MIDWGFKILEAGVIVMLIWWSINYLVDKVRRQRIEEKKRLGFIKRNFK